MTLNKLEKIFNKAIENNDDFIGIKIENMQNNTKEVVVIGNESFLEKLKYYKKIYNENCEMKSNNNIHITAVEYANNNWNYFKTMLYDI